MNYNNKKCAICGNDYYLCLSCQSNSLTPWKIYTDTSEHYKIYQILHGLNWNIYTIKEAKERLGNVDISDLDTFKEDVKIRIKEILSYKEEEKEANINDESVDEAKSVKNKELKNSISKKNTTRKKKKV